jgi:isochorismate hydrolase
MTEREAYYTTQNITATAQAFLNQLQDFRELHHAKIRPAKAALLVIDMQKFFCLKGSPHYLPSVPAILPQIIKLQELFVQHNLLVLQTRHSNTRENAGQMFTWWFESLLEESDSLAELIPEIVNPKIDVINKTQYDAFLATNLEERLKQAKVEQIVITGVKANLCCETTARSAFTRGFEVFFVVDATATNNREFHRSTLLNLAYGFAMPVLTEEVIQAVNHEK